MSHKALSEGSAFNLIKKERFNKRNVCLYLHTGSHADVLVIMAGAVNAEILVLLQTWIPLPPLALSLLLAFPPPLEPLSLLRFQKAGTVLRLAGHSD